MSNSILKKCKRCGYKFVALDNEDVCENCLEMIKIIDDMNREDFIMKPVEILVDRVIENLITINNPGSDKDTLEDLFQDVDQREEAINEIKEYLNQ